MIIADGVAIIPLEIGGFILNPTLIWDENRALLIDTGLPGQHKQLIEGIETLGVPIEHLKSVILTHQDIDHIGSLPGLMDDLEHPLAVYAHELDKPYIEGQKRLLKMELPEHLQHLFDEPYHTKVSHTLEDGDVLPILGGIHVIFTPGHTPGHISLYIPRSRILIAGDALPSVDGELKAPTNQTTPDLSAAQSSLRRFLDLEIDKVVCFHGGLCTDRVNEQFKRLVEKSS